MIRYEIESVFRFRCDGCKQTWIVPDESAFPPFSLGVSCPNCGQRHVPVLTNASYTHMGAEPAREYVEPQLAASTIGTLECAAILKCSAPHLKRLAREGKIPATKVGREWVFLRESVVEWLKKRIVPEPVPLPKKRGRPRKRVPLGF